MNKKRVYFWDLVQAKNRKEYYLKLQDKRLLDMYKDRLVLILIHCKKPKGWFNKTIHTIELAGSIQEGLDRLDLLGLNNEFIQSQDCVIKPAKGERFNQAISVPTIALITHKFTGDTPLPKLIFRMNDDAQQFLLQLNDATEQFLEAHSDLWQIINQ